jgi:hypothetical protein
MPSTLTSNADVPLLAVHRLIARAAVVNYTLYCISSKSAAREGQCCWFLHGGGHDIPSGMDLTLERPVSPLLSLVADDTTELLAPEVASA